MAATEIGTMKNFIDGDWVADRVQEEWSNHRILHYFIEE